MTATLRVVLDPLVAPGEAALREASTELTRALIATAPRGCDVAAIVPRGVDEPPVDGLADVTRLALPRRELAASWQLGVAPGVGKGLIHAPTLFAPLVRHDRVHETHQVVATLWDLRAWEAPDMLPKAHVVWQRAMLKRAEKHADALIVPTHAMAEALATHSRLRGRVRVIPGAAPEGFRIPTDVAGRVRALELPAAFVVLSGSAHASDGLAAGFRALAGSDVPVVVLDCPEGERDAVVELASAAGIPAERVHVLGILEPLDRAAVLGSASVYVATCTRSDWPWRVVEALAVSTPIVAVDTAAHREVLADAAVFAAADDLAAAVAAAQGDQRDRLRVLSADRAKGFAWREAAERVWQLHAEL